MPHRVGVIGLGVMGNRMLDSIARHPDFEARYAWDLNVARCNDVWKRHPDIEIPRSARELIGYDDVDIVYIASPPSTHAEYAGMAIEGGKATLCEKPLGVDAIASRSLVEKAKASGVPNAVNFSFATGPVAGTIREAVESGQTGEIVEVEMRFHFPRWPRAWQTAGRWLSERREGGFVREVFSHFAYLTLQTVGAPTLRHSAVVYPSEPGLSETGVSAVMESGGTPIRMTGRVGAEAPELVEWTLYGKGRSYRVRNWSELQVGSEEGWRDAMPGDWQGPSQLDAVSSMLRGEAHDLPDFEAGLQVQELVESILGNG